MSSRVQRTWRDLEHALREFIEAHDAIPRDCNACYRGEDVPLACAVRYRASSLLKKMGGTESPSDR